MRSAHYEVFRSLVFLLLQKETRLSERQIAQLRWSQIRDGAIYTPHRKKIAISRELEEAIYLLPRTHSLVFFGSPLSPRQDSEAMNDLRRQFELEDKMKQKSRKIFGFIGA